MKILMQENSLKCHLMYDNQFARASTCCHFPSRECSSSTTRIAAAPSTATSWDRHSILVVSELNRHIKNEMTGLDLLKQTATDLRKTTGDFRSLPSDSIRHNESGISLVQVIAGLPVQRQASNYLNWSCLRPFEKNLVECSSKCNNFLSRW